MVDNFKIIKNYISAVTEFIKESFEHDDDKYYTVASNRATRVNTSAPTLDDI